MLFETNLKMKMTVALIPIDVVTNYLLSLFGVLNQAKAKINFLGS